MNSKPIKEPVAVSKMKRNIDVEIVSISSDSEEYETDDIVVISSDSEEYETDDEFVNKKQIENLKQNTNVEIVVISSDSEEYESYSSDSEEYESYSSDSEEYETDQFVNKKQIESLVINYNHGLLNRTATSIGIQTDKTSCIECARRKLKRQHDFEIQATPMIQDNAVQTNIKMPLIQKLYAATPKQLISLNHYLELLFMLPQLSNDGNENIQLADKLLQIFDKGQTSEQINFIRQTQSRAISVLGQYLQNLIPQNASYYQGQSNYGNQYMKCPQPLMQYSQSNMQYPQPLMQYSQPNLQFQMLRDQPYQQIDVNSERTHNTYVPYSFKSYRTRGYGRGYGRETGYSRRRLCPKGRGYMHFY